MRSCQRAGPGVEDNGPGRAGPLRPVQVSTPDPVGELTMLPKPPNRLIVGFEKKLRSEGCFCDSGGECLHDPGGDRRPCRKRYEGSLLRRHGSHF